MLERAILFGAILEDVNDAYVERGVDIDKLFQARSHARAVRRPRAFRYARLWTQALALPRARLRVLPSPIHKLP